MLRTHPQIWMPPLKELHYFDRALTYPSTSLLASHNLFVRLFSRAPHNRELRRDCRAQLTRAFRRRDWSLVRWYGRYYLGGRDGQWYLSLFTPGGNRLRGEITPAYGMLDSADVARIHRLMPALKVIFLLRNPIERTWSHIRFEWKEGRFREIANPTEVRALIEHPGVALRSDYLRTLNIWESQFPPEQMFIGFFDDVLSAPDDLLRSIFSFLDVESSANEIAHVAKTSNRCASEEMPIPAETHRYLATKYLPDLERLSERFGGHAERWRAEAAALMR